ncbi:hypothetical protein ACLB2K_038343 [Fragaria x ananassa]
MTLSMMGTICVQFGWTASCVFNLTPYSYGSTFCGEKVTSMQFRITTIDTVWEEVAQSKNLNKYNHTIVDEQFAFYQDDGLTRFNALDPNKLLPSNVPEDSFIIGAHTPMSNLFSCLWFNEVERFTPRDQLSIHTRNEEG